MNFKLNQWKIAKFTDFPSAITI